MPWRVVRLPPRPPAQPWVPTLRPPVDVGTASINCSSVVSATVVATRVLSGSVNGSSTVSATLNATKVISATVNGSSTVTAAVVKDAAGGGLDQPAISLSDYYYG